MNSYLKLIIFVALIYSSMQGGYQCDSSVPNCQFCSYPNTCGLCNTNYMLTYNSNNGSFTCNQVLNCPSNCQYCYQNGICQQCNNNTFLTNNGSCSNVSTSGTVAVNCLWGSSISNCSICAYGYSLMSGFCYPVLTLTQNDQNCLVKMSQSMCQICMSGYIVNFIGKCVSNPQTYSCDLSNCLYCADQNNTHVCTMCSKGFALFNGTCINNACALINWCVTCNNSNSGTCTQCASGYTLNTSSNTCQAVGYGCNVANCMTCSWGQSCGQCNLGYQLTPFNTSSTSTVYMCTQIICPFNVTNCNACVQNYNSIFQFNQTLCAPNSCAMNYINVHGLCVPNITSMAIPCNVSNCVSCSVNNFCQSCSNGYYLTRAGSCLPNICNVQNCQSCSLNNICQQCSSGYILTIGGLAIMSYTNIITFNQFIGMMQCTLNTSISCNVNNCQYCLSNNTCTVCADGYTLNNNVCTASCNVTNCYMCGSNNMCSTCMPGYTLGSNGTQCTAITFSCSSGCMSGNCLYNWNMMMG
jgi:hypothetical protein